VTDRSRRGATSIEAILAATRQVVAERGPDRFTMSAIAKAAGVSRPTLYRWFPTKDSLLEEFSAYEQRVFAERLRAVVSNRRTPARRLDAALRFVVTYLDGLMGPDPIGADPAFAMQSLAAALAPQTDVFAAVLGDALDAVPAVQLGQLTRVEAADLFLRFAYSQFLFPHPDVEQLLANLRNLAGLTPGGDASRRPSRRPRGG
jgi:AcrR family transcriptional regulator